MNKATTTILVVLAIAVSGFLIFSDGSSQPQQPADQPKTTTNIDSNQPDESTTSPTSTDDRQPEDNVNPTTSASPAENGSANSPAATVTYEDGQFSPQTVTIRQGQTVRFESVDGNMWVGVDQHPTHTEYDGTSLQEHCNGRQKSFDQCEVGDTYSFTFDEAGEFGYHNHVNPSAGGMVIVQ
ncbi:MAG: hypothetical protein BRC25_00890 [Parcubacteria group bacterium SW_6_46_9]|nr:MAG: hypothetical protein BRC25_00890 [Parcubacteria group bacterium SW_6_46_9]